MKLTFVGDLACDRPLLKAAHNGKEYDFSNVFQTQDVFSGSDLVIGNLESCFGGGKYGKKPMHYNVPDSFAKAIKQAGIDFVSTANNHCMDEGVTGLQRTLLVLDREGIKHTGTFNPGDKRYAVKTIQNIKVGFFSVTYSVNGNIESWECDDLSKYINIIGYTSPSYSKNRIARYFQCRFMPSAKKFVKKRILRKSLVSQHTDPLTDNSVNSEWLAQIDKDFLNAREEAEVVCVLMHSGGQFNEQPGEFSEFIFEHFRNLGADIIVGHHPHIIQKIREEEGCLCAYSLGGACLSPSADYLIHETLPEYSVALHVLFDDQGKRISYEVEFLKCIEDADQYVHVVAAEKESSNIESLKHRISGNTQQQDYIF